MDSFVPTYVAATDITAVAGTTAMPDTSLVKQSGLKEKREYDKSIPFGMQLAAELQITLDYAELTTAQQEVILNPAVNVGSSGGIDYVLTNVWTLKTDRGSSGATWYVEGQYSQRRTPEQEFIYDATGSAAPTMITLTLHDIRRVIMERCEVYTATGFETPLGTFYTDYYIASDGLSDFYSRKITDVGKGSIMYGTSLANFKSGQQSLWQQLYRYMVRDTAAVVSFMQPYGQAVLFYKQAKQYHKNRSATVLSESDLKIISSVYPASTVTPTAADRLAGAFSTDEEGLLSETAYSWDFMRFFVEWVGAKECWYVSEVASVYTLNLEYYPLLDSTRNASVRALAFEDIPSKTFKMLRGGSTIRKVEYVNRGSVDDDREAIVVENKGSISENGWSIQGVFSVELDMYEKYQDHKQLSKDKYLDNVHSVYFAPFQLSTIGINQRKLLVVDFDTILTISPPHATPDIEVGYGAVTVGSTGTGYPPELADLNSSYDGAGNKKEAEIVKAVLAEQDNSSYGNALARVVLFLFGNESNRLWKIKVDFDATAGTTLMPHNVGDAYQIPSSWITQLGGDDRAILTKAEVDWLGRTMESEFLNVYDTDITGA